MKAVNHKITHQYQSTSTSCSPTALSMLLAHYDIIKTPNEIMDVVPQFKDEKGANAGSINQQLATWCIEQGFRVSFYSFDCQIIDQSWAGLTSQEIIARLGAGMEGYEVPALGKLWSNAYRQAYVDFLKAGGNLYILPSVSSELLYSLLQNGPILPCVCDNTLYGVGRSSHKGDKETIADDVNGKATTHSLVIYGNDEQGNFLVADPWHKPGLHIIEPERMLAAISTAQIECDNLLFQIQK